MILDNIKNHPTSWICGMFDHAVLKTNFEVGIKEYSSGEYNPAHYHKHTHEISIILEGCGYIEIFNRDNNSREIYHIGKDDIIVINPYEIMSFKAISNCKMVVIKTNSDLNDKEIFDGYQS